MKQTSIVKTEEWKVAVSPVVSCTVVRRTQLEPSVEELTTSYILQIRDHTFPVLTQSNIDQIITDLVRLQLELGKVGV